MKLSTGIWASRPLQSVSKVLAVSLFFISPISAIPAEAGPTKTPKPTISLLVSPKGSTTPGYGFEFNSKASTKIDIWEDFQCLHCGSFERLAGSRISELISSGKYKVTYHTMAFIGPESIRLANASGCASDENKFLKFHEHFFTLQSGAENSGIWTNSYILAQSKSIGLASKAFISCVNSGRYSKWLEAVTKSAVANKLTATPTVYINGHELNRITDYSSLSAFNSAVDNPDGIVANSPTSSPSPSTAAFKLNFSVTKVFGMEPIVGAAQGAPPTNFGYGEIILGSGNPVQVGDTITVQEKIINWSTNEVLANTWTKTPVTFKLSSRIKGLQDGLPGMKVGGRRILVLPPDWAFGPNGNASIPAGATLIYIVDLLAVSK